MKKSKNIFPLFVIGLFISATLAFTIKPEDHGPVHWIKFSEAVEKCKKQPKMIIIDIYTTWCGPCKMLTAQTFGNEKIAKYMNDNFYCVKFDAETRDTVKFSMMVADTVKDKTTGKVKKINQKAQEYKFFNTFPPEASRSTHQFAASILSGHQIAFPSVVFLTKDIKRVDVIQGFYPPAQFEPIVKFFGSGSWENSKYEDFQKNFKSELNPR